MEYFRVVEAGEGIERAILRGLTHRGKGMSAWGLPEGLRAASAVSYGASPKNSLTVSSRRGERLWAALQRELVTVEGRVVERQEFPVPFLSHGELASLAVAGALLLLGVPPEELDLQEK